MFAQADLAYGDEIEAYWPDDNVWLPATLQVENEDGTLDIEWEDGSVSSGLPADYARRPTKAEAASEASDVTLLADSGVPLATPRPSTAPRPSTTPYGSSSTTSDSSGTSDDEEDVALSEEGVDAEDASEDDDDANEVDEANHWEEHAEHDELMLDVPQSTGHDEESQLFLNLVRDYEAQHSDAGKLPKHAEDQWQADDQLPSGEDSWTQNEHQDHSDDTLPIAKMRDRLISVLFGKSPVCCILGETGCGKSTQVPQIIVREAARRQTPARVAVTQPRRVAAISLARRVAEEFGDAGAGGKVGYRIGGESKSGEFVEYCTTGYLLQLLVNSPSEIGRYTHVVLDEVHERSAESDMLCLVVRLLARVGDSQIRIVVMSATLQAELFARYFAQLSGAKPETIFVGAKRFPVQEYFLDDLLKAFQGKLRCPSDVHAHMRRMDGKTMGANQVDHRHVEKMQQLVIDVVRCIAKGGCTVLVFVPGILEISTLWEEARSLESSGSFRILPLHSMIPREEQEAVFQVPPPHVAHVVLATDIAESSLTLPNVVGVVDLGLHRRIDRSDNRGMAALATKWISRASAKQRTGRAGRTRPGICVHLYSRNFHGKVMLEHDAPESESMPLDRLYLQAKQLGAGLASYFGEDPASTCAQAMLAQLVQPPEPSAVAAARDGLAHMGAITVPEEEASITVLGRLCLQLPLELSLTRLVWLGAHWGKVVDAVVLATALACAEPFLSPSPFFIEDEGTFVKRLQDSTWTRLYFDDGLESEPLMLRRLFLKWLEFFTGQAQNFRSKNEALRARQLSIEHFSRKFGLACGRMVSFVSQVLDIALRTFRVADPSSRVANQLLNFVSCLGYSVDSRGDLSAAGCDASPDLFTIFDPCDLSLKSLLAAAFSHHLLVGSYYSGKELSNQKKGKKATLLADPSARLSTKQKLLDAMYSSEMPLVSSAAFATKHSSDLRSYISTVCGTTLVAEKKVVIQDGDGIIIAHAQQHEPTSGQPYELSLLHQYCLAMKDLEKTKASWAFGMRPIENPCMINWQASSPSHKVFKAVCNRRNALGYVLRPPLEWPWKLQPLAVLAVAASMQGSGSPNVVFAAGVTVLPGSFVSFVLATAQLQSDAAFGIGRSGTLALPLRPCLRFPDGLITEAWWEQVRRLREELRKLLLDDRPGTFCFLHDSTVEREVSSLIDMVAMLGGEALEETPQKVGSVSLVGDNVSDAASVFAPMATWAEVQRRIRVPERTTTKALTKAERKAANKAAKKATKEAKRATAKVAKVAKVANVLVSKNGNQDAVKLCRRVASARQQAAAGGFLPRMIQALTQAAALAPNTGKFLNKCKKMQRACKPQPKAMAPQPKATPPQTKAMANLVDLEDWIRQQRGTARSSILAPALPQATLAKTVAAAVRVSQKPVTKKDIKAIVNLISLISSAKLVASAASSQTRTRVLAAFDSVAQMGGFSPAHLGIISSSKERFIKVVPNGQDNALVVKHLNRLEVLLRASGSQPVPKRPLDDCDGLAGKRRLIDNASSASACATQVAAAPAPSSGSRPVPKRPLDDCDGLAGKRRLIDNASSASTCATQVAAAPAPQEIPEGRQYVQALPQTVDEWRAAQERLFGDLPPLPDGWIRMRSRSTLDMYFYNFKRGESTFDMPMSAEVTPPNDFSLPKSTSEWVSAQGRLFGHLPPLPHSWIRIKSKSTGATYYYNVDTQESTTTMPSIEIC